MNTFLSLLLFLFFCIEIYQIHPLQRLEEILRKGKEKSVNYNNNDKFESCPLLFHESCSFAIILVWMMGILATFVAAQRINIYIEEKGISDMPMIIVGMLIFIAAAAQLINYERSRAPYFLERARQIYGENFKQKRKIPKYVPIISSLNFLFKKSKLLNKYKKKIMQ